MDNLTAEQRRLCMSRIKSRNTKAELKVRLALWNLGIRGYRIHSKIKGKPDIYFSKKKLAVFIDGCFWHKCPRCYVRPKSKNEYWDKKIGGNVIRDKAVNLILQESGIKVLRFWEHEVKEDLDSVIDKIIENYEK